MKRHVASSNSFAVMEGLLPSCEDYFDQTDRTSNAEQNNARRAKR